METLVNFSGFIANTMLLIAFAADGLHNGYRNYLNNWRHTLRKKEIDDISKKWHKYQATAFLLMIPGYFFLFYSCVYVLDMWQTYIMYAVYPIVLRWAVFPIFHNIAFDKELSYIGTTASMDKMYQYLSNHLPSWLKIYIILSIFWLRIFIIIYSFFFFNSFL